MRVEGDGICFFLVWRYTVIEVLQLEHVMKVNVLVACRSLLLKGAMLGSINGINNISIKEPAT